MLFPGSSHPLLPSRLFPQLLTILTTTQILKPAEKKKTFAYGGTGSGRPVTPPRKAKGGKGKGQ